MFMLPILVVGLRMKNAVVEKERKFYQRLCPEARYLYRSENYSVPGSTGGRLAELWVAGCFAVCNTPPLRFRADT